MIRNDPIAGTMIYPTNFKFSLGQAKTHEYDTMLRSEVQDNDILTTFSYCDISRWFWKIEEWEDEKNEKSLKRCHIML